MKKWQKALVILMGLMLLGVTACSLPSKASTDGQQVAADRGDIAVVVAGSGNLATQQEARLSFKTNGKIADIPCREGDTVAQGTALASLETEALALAKKQAEVDLAKAKAGYKEALAVLSAAELALQTAEYELGVARAAEETLKLAVLNAQIALDQAQNSLDAGITAVDYEAAKAELNKAKAWYDYVKRMLQEATDDVDSWLLAWELAQDRLDVAQAQYDNTLVGYDTEQIVLKKKQVEAAEMALAQAEWDLDNHVQTIALKELAFSAARETVDQAQEGVAYAEQSVELAEQALSLAVKNLAEATLTAPFDGVIASIEVKPGDVITTATLIIRLVDPTLLELIVEVDEMDVPKVSKGQEAQISVDALPDDDFTGTVAAVYPVPAKVTGLVMYNVMVALSVPEDSALKIGMRATANIIVEKKTGVVKVPSTAVKENAQGEHFVNVIVDKKTEQRPVSVGISNGTETEITSGLSEGETVAS